MRALILLAVVVPAPLLADEPIPRDAADQIAAFEEDADAIRFEAERRIALERRALAKRLKVLQDQYTRAAKLDEAVAIRDYIRTLSLENVDAEPAPPNVLQLAGQVGRSFYFKVTGNQNGSCYGTDVYTGDSLIATAAVHTGVLKHGQEGVVKVRVLPSRNSYASSTRNGVTSSAWGTYSVSYSVERVKNVLGDEEPAGEESPAEDPAADPAGGDSAVDEPAPERPETAPAGEAAAPEADVAE